MKWCTVSVHKYIFKKGKFHVYWMYCNFNEIYEAAQAFSFIVYASVSLKTIETTNVK